MMKAIIGLILIIAGIVLGLYVGIWVCFIGGIVQVIDQIRAPELTATIVAWGIAKIFLAGLFGWLSAMLGIIPGYALLHS